MVYLKFLAVAALIGAIAWTIYEPGFEPALAIVGALSTLLSLLIVERRKNKNAAQNQSISTSSVGIQAGGDINIGSIGAKLSDD